MKSRWVPAGYLVPETLCTSVASAEKRFKVKSCRAGNAVYLRGPCRKKVQGKKSLGTSGYLWVPQLCVPLWPRPKQGPRCNVAGLETLCTSEALAENRFKVKSCWVPLGTSGYRNSVYLRGLGRSKVQDVKSQGRKRCVLPRPWPKNGSR